MIGYRKTSVFLNAFFQKQNYIAFINMIQKYPNFIDSFNRYLWGSGNYPYSINIKVNGKILNPTIYSYHDMLTVNEVFCRLDYMADKNIKTIVDIGSNIGITALYFLTKNNNSKCYLYEPDNRNIYKLKKNLKNYKDRYVLYENAVSHKKSIVDFSIEETGRYGGINLDFDKTIKVECLDINDVIDNVLTNECSIDILKIDIEGLEEKTVRSIKTEFLNKIKNIYMECKPNSPVFPKYFHQKQYGPIYQLFNKSLI